jgi:hypothetical protein
MLQVPARLFFRRDDFEIDNNTTLWQNFGQTKGSPLHRRPQNMNRRITALLIAVIFVSGIANAASQCCAKMPEAGVAFYETAAVAGDGRCPEGQPPCRIPQAAAPQCPSTRTAVDDAGETCCKSDRNDKFKPVGFLRASAPPYPLALDQQANTLESVGAAGGAVAPESRPAFPQTTPIYLLNSTILR